MWEDKEPGDTNNDMGEAAINAYRLIHKEIISGTFKPGDQLSERVLSELTGVSRTPIREALRRLNSDGMVTVESNRTAYVADVNRREIEEIFSLARLLGNHSACLAAQRISDSALDELLVLVEKLEALLTREDDDLFKAFAEIDRSFHLIIRQAAGNYRLIRFGKSLLSAPILFQAMARFTRDHYESFVPIYRKIYDALRARDPDQAETAMNNFSAASHEATLSSLIDMEYAETGCIGFSSSVALPTLPVNSKG